jgi:hypothetical protein
VYASARRAACTAAMSALFLVLTACGTQPAGVRAASGVPSVVSSAAATPSPVALRDPHALYAAADRRAILSLAAADFKAERASRFADVREAPVSDHEAGRAVLGEVGTLYRIVPSELATVPFLVDAVRPQRLDAAVVPITLGNRQLAEMCYVKANGRWSWTSTACESVDHDRDYVMLCRSLGLVLGGAPDEKWTVSVAGSVWVVARRGNAEAAGLQSAGHLSGGVRLPPEGSVLTSGQFRTLVLKMQARR